MYLLLFLHYDNHFHFNGHRQLYNVVPTQRIYTKKYCCVIGWDAVVSWQNRIVGGGLKPIAHDTICAYNTTTICVSEVKHAYTFSMGIFTSRLFQMPISWLRRVKVVKCAVVVAPSSAASLLDHVDGLGRYRFSRIAADNLRALNRWQDRGMSACGDHLTSTLLWLLINFWVTSGKQFLMHSSIFQTVFYSQFQFSFSFVTLMYFLRLNFWSFAINLSVF